MKAAATSVASGHFSKSTAIRKVDEKEQQAWGLFTAEVVDSDNEKADYAYQKGRVQAWSDECKSNTTKAGQEQSLGNVRFSHTVQPVGKVIALLPDDSAKEIGGGTYIYDPQAWDMVKKGILQGFSFGGRYDWRKCDECGRDLPLVQGDNYCDGCGKPVIVRYGASIAELSVVDRPAVPVALIQHIKADGSVVEVPSMDKEKKTKRVAGEDLTADCFAYVGDAEDTSTWKLPIKFSTEAKTKRHIINALARFSQTKGIPADEKAKVKAKIVAAAKEHGIEVDEEEEKAEATGFKKTFVKAEVAQLRKEQVAKLEKALEGSGLTVRKDLFDVANFAEILQRIAWLRYSALNEREYEGDDSPLPEELETNLISLSETFIRMAEEETAELIEAAKKAGKVTEMKIGKTTDVNKGEVELAPEVSDALTGHIVEMQAHHEAAGKAHKEMAAHHEEHAKVHKEAHDHFKSHAEAGGEHEMHHAMHAKVHKAMADHHETKAAHHKAMGDLHEAHAAKCGKMAEALADTPEKATKLKDLQKAARDAQPILKAPAPVAASSKAAGSAMNQTEPVFTSDAERNAYSRAQEEWFNSDEYKEMTKKALRDATARNLTANADKMASLTVGTDEALTKTGVTAVHRTGQVSKNSSEADVDVEEIFSFAK